MYPKLPFNHHKKGIEIFGQKSVNHDMRKTTLVLFGAVALLICSCIPSVNPFYTEKDLTTDPRLPGIWQDNEANDDSSVWKFEFDGTNAYNLTINESRGRTGEFSAHLFKLDSENFLDLIPLSCDYATNQAGLVGAAMIPGHLLVRVSSLSPTLHLALCDPDWLKKYLDKNPNAIAHRDYEGGIFLTAETRDLQKFILKHLAKGELFSDGGDLTRTTNAVSAPPK